MKFTKEDEKLFDKIADKYIIECYWRIGKKKRKDMLDVCRANLLPCMAAMEAGKCECLQKAAEDFKKIKENNERNKEDA